MKTLKRSLIAVTIASTISLAACGYSPLYSQYGDNLSRVQIGSVSMKNIDRNVGQRRVAQLVKQRLLQTFPASGNTDYTLSIVIEETASALAVREDAVEQRLSLRLNSDATLTPQDASKAIIIRTEAASTYSVEDSPFGTDSGRVRARRAAADLLSTKIAQKVAVLLNQQQTEQVEE